MKKFTGIIALVLFLACGLAVAGFVDLSLTQSLYNPKNAFAIFMEAFGYWPLYLPTALMFAAGALLSKQGIKKWGNFLLCAVTLSVLTYMGFHYLQKRNAVPMIFVAALGIAAVLVPVFINAKRAAVLKKLWFAGAFGFVYMLANNIVINAFKFLWQRPRYDDMLAEGRLSSFAPWYQIMNEGGSSFPSGHTGAACGIFVILILCSLFTGLSRKKGIMLIGCFAYVAAMALARMIMGRHFLSDTVAAAFIGYGLFLIMTYLPVYQKTLAGTLAAASEND